MTFTCERESTSAVSVRLDKQEMEATGPKWATRIIIAMASIMETNSRSTFRVEDNELVCEANIEASFHVPRWVPIPLKNIQEGGLTAVEKQVNGDVAKMVVNLLKSDPGEGPGGHLAREKAFEVGGEV